MGEKGSEGTAGNDGARVSILSWASDWTNLDH